ncbi:helix-turn-helix transcriptional regulator [Epibacterium ulvae]|uniref:helix-turn-helix transcriptional regulator n=1 Tax=Epibacterium ulvae TaxID=1156985 RepID=UPI00249151C4|nr:LuxR C-terminal-related transcriptional regulator [Epibacterium ulvae]
MPGVKTMAPLPLDDQQLMTPNAEGELVVFIGPQKSFTHTVLRIVDEEIEDILPLRYETLDAFLPALKTLTSGIRLVIVDACACERVLHKIQEMAHGAAAEYPHHQMPGFVVAYWNEANAHSTLERLGGSLGLQGFLPMNQSIDIWLAVLRLFLSGGSYLPSELLEQNITTPQPTPAVNGETATDPTSSTISEAGGEAIVLSPAALDTSGEEKEVLTQREVAVMEEVVNGLQNKQIAAKLKVSEHTIKLHIHHIITKLRVNNRTAAAMKFVTTCQYARA